MVVTVFVVRRHTFERLAAVVGDTHPHVHLVDTVEDVWAGENFLVVVRPGASGDVVVLFGPTFTAVGRAVEASFAVGQLDRRVNHVGVLVRNRQPDPAHVFLGKAVDELAPRLAAVGALVDPRFGTAIDQRGDIAKTLVGRGVERVRPRRVLNHLVDACGFVVTAQFLPGGATVGGLEQTAVTAYGPQRPLGGHVNDVGVARVDHDRSDVLRRRKTHLLPVFPAVGALVNAITVTDMAPADVFAGPDPDRFRMRRVDRQATDRVGGLLVKDRRPTRPGVRRLPHAAAADGGVPDALIFGMDRDVGDPSRHQRRTDASKLESGERFRREPRRVLLFFGGAFILFLPGRRRREHQGEAQHHQQGRASPHAILRTWQMERQALLRGSLCVASLFCFINRHYFSTLR